MKQLRPHRAVVILMAFLSWVVIGQSAPVFAQSGADANMQILRDKLKADKKLVVAANMELTDAEAKGFWPVYDAYQKDLQSLNERLKKAILSYADAYNNRTLTDERARQLSDEAIAIDEQEIQMCKACELHGTHCTSQAFLRLDVEAFAAKALKRIGPLNVEELPLRVELDTKRMRKESRSDSPSGFPFRFTPSDD